MFYRELSDALRCAFHTCVCMRRAALLLAPATPAESGALFFGDFLLAAQKKVTSSRAAPGDNQSA